MSRIRPATLEDVSSIRQIARNSWHAAYDDVLGPEAVDELVDRWYAARSLEQSIRRTNRREADVFLIGVLEESTVDGSETPGESGENTQSESVVGFAQATPVQHEQTTLPTEATTAELIRIYVDPDSWGNSVGSALLERVEEALEGSFERLRVTVLADNAVGISFYESTGFERLETHASDLDDIVDGQDSRDGQITEYVYEKPL